LKKKKRMTVGLRLLDGEERNQGLEIAKVEEGKVKRMRR